MEEEKREVCPQRTFVLPLPHMHVHRPTLHCTALYGKRVPKIRITFYVRVSLFSLRGGQKGKFFGGMCARGKFGLAGFVCARFSTKKCFFPRSQDDSHLVSYLKSMTRVRAFPAMPAIPVTRRAIPSILGQHTNYFEM